MPTYSAEVWILLAGIASAAIFSILHCMAITIRNEHQYHQLKLKASRVRAELQAQLAADDDRRVIIVDEAPGESTSRAA